MRHVYGIGETVLDILFKNNMPIAAVPGGSTFNSMVSLGRTVHRCGHDCKVVMVTDTGDDHVADMELDFMRDNGVDSSLVIRQHACQSPVSLAFLNEHNDASYEFYRSAVQAELTPESFGDGGRMPECAPGDIVLFGSFFAVSPRSRKLVKALLKQASEAGAILYYDVNFRPNHIKDLPALRQEIIDNMELATIVKMSSEDARCLYGDEAPEPGKELALWTYAKQPKPVFIMTCGSKPVQLVVGGNVSEYPVEAVTPVSTIGAGDNFNAGFIYGMVSRNLGSPVLPGGNVDADYPWADLFGCATAFSREVCRSLQNYVPDGFEI